MNAALFGRPRFPSRLVLTVGELIASGTLLAGVIAPGTASRYGAPIQIQAPPPGS